MSSSIKSNGYSVGNEASSTSNREMGDGLRGGGGGGGGGFSAAVQDGPVEFADKYSPVNPFVHRIQLSTFDKIKLAFMTVTLFPIRVIMISSCLVCAWFFSCILMTGRSKDDERSPMSGWRRFLRPVVIFFARGVFFMAGFHWVTVKGKRASSAEASILATAPHSSYMDALSVTYLGLTSVVAKTEAENVPFFGTLTKFTQPVLVSREDPCSRQNTVKEIQRRAATGGEWPQIIIFTEGTCTNRTCLISFKPGAFIPGVPVQPVCLKYRNKFDTVTWTWNGPTALKIMWLTLCQFDNSFEIEFLPVYTPNEEEKKDIKLFGQNVRARMAKALDVPTIENSFEDGQAMMNAVRLHLPNADILVHINRIVRQLGISSEDLKLLLVNLCKAVQSAASCLVTLEEFASHLKSSPSSQSLNELFLFFRKGGECAIDLRKFLIVLFLLRLPMTIDEVLRFSFEVYDRTAKGFLSIHELDELLVDIGLPRSVISLISKCGDGPALKITYEIFKTNAEKLLDYKEFFFQPPNSTDRKEPKKSKSVTEEESKRKTE